MLKDYKRFVRNTAKRWLPLLLAVFLFLSAVNLVSAQVDQLTVKDVGLQGAGSAEEIGLPASPLRTIIVRGVQVLLGFLGIIFVIMVIYGGYQYMTAGGAPEKIDLAKRTLRNGVIGMLISLSSFAIVSFFVSTLLGITGIPGIAPPPRYGSGSGALGGGIIESHYPGRNAFNIPRNTAIVVTFKEVMDMATMIQDANNDGIYGNCTGSRVMDDANGNGIVDSGEIFECDVVSSNIRIRKTADDPINGPFVNFVRASTTLDNKTIVLKPVTFLGNPENPERYTVELTGDITKANGQPAFGNFGNYDWSFEVSTEIDVSPPQVDSVIPLPTNDPADAVARNAVVQINFNEAINPLTLQGDVTVEGGGTVGTLTPDSFDILQVFNQAGFNVAGSFRYSNQYRTVEFITNDTCGVNSCNEEIFCLPGNDAIEVLIRAAKLFQAPTASFPYTGVVDMADNSLDGNYDTVAQGTSVGATTDTTLPPYDFNNPDPSVQGDDAQWSFYTSNEVDLIPPQILRMYPTPNQFDVNPRNPFEVEFDKLLMASTLKPDSAYGDGYCGCFDDSECGAGQVCSPTLGYCVGETTNERIACVSNDECANTQGPGGTALCTQKEHLTLAVSSEIPEGEGYAYWVRSQNDLSTEHTTALIAHEVLGPQLRFQSNAGSGVKDLFQNCFQPCSGPGCNRQAVPGVPGRYVVSPGNWLPTNASYPTCNLTQSAIGASGDFRISYDDGTGFKDLGIQGFSFDQDPQTFYGYSLAPASNASIDRWGFPFDEMLRAGRSVAFIYHNNLVDRYYLFIIHNTAVVGGGGGAATLRIGRAGSYGSVIFVDDTSDSVTGDGADLIATHTWNDGTTDGTIIDLGSNPAAITFDLQMDNATGVTEWKFFHPGGSIDLALDGIATITPQ